MDCAIPTYGMHEVRQFIRRQKNDMVLMVNKRWQFAVHHMGRLEKVWRGILSHGRPGIVCRVSPSRFRPDKVCLVVLSRQVVPNWKDVSGGREGLRDISPPDYSPPDYCQDCSSPGPLPTMDEDEVVHVGSGLGALRSRRSSGEVLSGLELS